MSPLADKKKVKIKQCTEWFQQEIQSVQKNYSRYSNTKNSVRIHCGDQETKLRNKDCYMKIESSKGTFILVISFMFLCLECTVSFTFFFRGYYFGKIIILWFHSSTQRITAQSIVFSQRRQGSTGVSIMNMTEEWTQSSVKEVLINFLIAKAIFTSENSCEPCTRIAKKYCLQQQKILRKTNRIGQSPGKLQDIKCI